MRFKKDAIKRLKEVKEDLSATATRLAVLKANVDVPSPHKEVLTAIVYDLRSLRVRLNGLTEDA